MQSDQVLTYLIVEVKMDIVQLLVIYLPLVAVEAVEDMMELLRMEDLMEWSVDQVEEEVPMVELLLKDMVCQEKEQLVKDLMVVVDLTDQDLTVLVAVAVHPTNLEAAEEEDEEE